MPNFTGYPLSSSYTDLTLSAGTHPTAHNVERAALNHLQGQLLDIRHRRSAAAASMAAGDTTLNFATQVDTVGSITWANPNFTLPSLGLYYVTAVGTCAAGFTNATAGANNDGIQISVGGLNHFFPLMEGTSNSCGGTVIRRCAAGSTVSVVYRNNSGAARTASFDVEVTRLRSHI